MAITQAMCTSFKGQLMTATHNFTASTGDAFYIALYTSSATLGATTTAYSATNEVVGTAYVAGGNLLVNVTPTTSGTTGLTDFSDTSSLIKKMDFVVSVDSVIAHLAGALNKKTFLLLPDKSSFLWMKNKKDSPWYPSIKIFRQSTLGDWDKPIKQIISELKS